MDRADLLFGLEASPDDRKEGQVPARSAPNQPRIQGEIMKTTFFDDGNYENNHHQLCGFKVFFVFLPHNLYQFVMSSTCFWKATWADWSRASVTI